MVVGQEAGEMARAAAQALAVVDMAAVVRVVAVSEVAVLVVVDLETVA